MNANAKDSELPAADSCAIMEGEDAEDDLIFTSKNSLFGKIKAFTSKVRGLQCPAFPKAQMTVITLGLAPVFT